MNWKCDQMSWIMKIEFNLACFIRCDFVMGYVYEGLNDLFIYDCGDLEWFQVRIYVKKRGEMQKQWGLKIAKNKGDFEINVAMIGLLTNYIFGQ